MDLCNIVLKLSQAHFQHHSFNFLTFNNNQFIKKQTNLKKKKCTKNVQIYLSKFLNMIKKRIILFSFKWLGKIKSINIVAESIVLIYKKKQQQMFITQKLRQELYQKITKQQYNKIDLTNEQVIKQLSQFIQTLQTTLDNLSIIKTLIRAYGLPIIIYMKPFYEKAAQDSQFFEQNKHVFIKLASIAQGWTQGQQIHQINFIYSFGKPTKKPRVNEKDEVDIKFIHYIKQIGIRNKEIYNNYPNCKEDLQKYRQDYYIKPNDKQSQFDIFMLKSLEKFKISQHQLQQMERKITQQKNNEAEIQKEGNSYYQSQSYLNESMSGNYYNQITVDKKTYNNLYSSQASQNNSKGLIQQCSYSSFLQNMPEIQKSSTLSSNSKSNQQYCIKTPQKSQKIEINIPISDPICCRTFFYEEQIINQKESQAIAFMNAPFPFRSNKIYDIRKTICSFLNHEGGILFIGIVKEENKYIVTGSQICEGSKQTVLRTFRQIFQIIQPDILTNKIYNIEFVPIRSSYNQKYIKGTYIIKVIVKYGNRDDIYSFKDNGNDQFAFRQNGKIVFKQGRQLMIQLARRIQHPIPIPKPFHTYPCKKPQIGQLLNKIYYDTAFNKKKGIEQNHLWHSDEASYKTKQIQQANKIYQESPKQCINNQEKSPIQKIKPFQVHYDKERNIIFNSNKKVEETYHHPQKSNKQVKWVYFYAIGLLKKQLLPVLVKKGIDSKLNIQQSDQSLVLKVSDEQAVKQSRKIFKKLQQKYQDTYPIKFYQLSLELQVQNINKVAIELKNMKLQYKINTQKLIKFKFYKDSLKAFLDLTKKGLNIKFYQPNLN